MQNISQNLLMTEKQISDLFNSLDCNDNGLLEFSEFATAAAMPQELFLSKETLRVAFNVLDLNNDEHISAEEVRISFQPVLQE